MELLHTVGHFLNFGHRRSYFAPRSISQMPKALFSVVQADHKIAHDAHELQGGRFSRQSLEAEFLGGIIDLESLYFKEGDLKAYVMDFLLGLVLEHLQAAYHVENDIFPGSAGLKSLKRDFPQFLSRQFL
jgi:hypothetical protein